MRNVELLDINKFLKNINTYLQIVDRYFLYLYSKFMTNGKKKNLEKKL